MSSLPTLARFQVLHCRQSDKPRRKLRRGSPKSAPTGSASRQTLSATQVRTLKSSLSCLKVVETFRFGLKKQHLNPFMKQVDDFYVRVIVDKQYKSDLVCTYQKRFIRYRDSLFTFLNLDDIPWNNNAAERAIRPFAIQREVSKSPFHACVLRNYLVLLGIRQTCRFQDKSFFKFLFSGEVELENFSTEAHRR